MPPGPAARLASVVAAIGILLALPAATLAHAALDTASPGPDSVVESQPEALVATFTEPVDPAKTTMEIRDAGGAVVARGAAADIDDAGLTMTISLPTLADGTYEVRWTTAALDGHIERGTYRFTVVIVAAASPSLEPSLEPPASPSAASSPSPTPVPVSPSPTPVTSSPVATPSASPALSASASPSPVDAGSAASEGAAVLLPVLAALAVVGALAVWFLRRRRA